jgi:hypothetical protein
MKSVLGVTIGIFLGLFASVSARDLDGRYSDSQPHHKRCDGVEVECRSINRNPKRSIYEDDSESRGMGGRLPYFCGPVLLRQPYGYVDLRNQL